jgi:hypothetical protein
LSKYSEKCIAPSKDDKPNIASFLFSDGANVSVVAFAGVLYLELYMDDLNISFKGKASGTTSPVIAKSIGKLYYNNLNDLTNGCDFECNFWGVYPSAYPYINFIHGSPTFATFQGDLTPLIWIGGGNGQWSSSG